MCLHALGGMASFHWTKCLKSKEITNGTQFSENSKQLPDNILLGKAPHRWSHTIIKDALTSKRWPNFWIRLPALLHHADNLPRAVLSDVVHIWPVPRLNADHQLLLTDGIYKAKRSLTWDIVSGPAPLRQGGGRTWTMPLISLCLGNAFGKLLHLVGAESLCGKKLTYSSVRWSNNILISADERENSQQSCLPVEQMKHVNKANGIFQILTQRQQIWYSSCL